MRIAPGLTAIVLCLMGAACAPAAAVPLSAKRDGVAIEVVALRDDVIRVRIGRNLARQDSYAIRPDALTAQTRAEITHDASGDHLKTAAMDVVLDPKTLRLTVKDASGRTVLDDAAPAPGLHRAILNWANESRSNRGFKEQLAQLSKDMAGEAPAAAHV